MGTAKRQAKQQAQREGLDPDLIRYAGRRARHWRLLGIHTNRAVRFGVDDARVAQHHRDLEDAEAL